MVSLETQRIISQRLIKENVCSAPLDDYSINIIDEYMRYIRSESDLCRRLSDIELNYVQISSESQNASEKALAAKEELAKRLRALGDSWSEKGILRDFVFSYNEDDLGFIKHSYANALEYIRSYQSTITGSLMTVSETAAQIRACAASFTEVYKESKLAVYAAMLNKNVQDVLDCRAVSLQAHASANECERHSSRLLGIARCCTRIITSISKLLVSTSDSLGMDYSGNQNRRIIHPNSAFNVISEAVTTLEGINFEI